MISSDQLEGEFLPRLLVRSDSQEFAQLLAIVKETGSFDKMLQWDFL